MNLVCFSLRLCEAWDLQPVDCDETCPFCGHRAYGVRAFVTHFDDCELKKNQESLGVLSPEQLNRAIQCPQRLVKTPSDKLDEQLSANEHLNRGQVLSGVSSGGTERRIRQPPKLVLDTANPHEQQMMEHGAEPDAASRTPCYPLLSEAVVVPQGSLRPIHPLTLERNRWHPDDRFVDNGRADPFKSRT